jgi:hypothetical protein
MIEEIATQTNLYQSQDITRLSSKTASWYPTNKEKLYCFLAITLLMGINPKPKISDYWSTDELLYMLIFPKIFTRNRYKYILRYLHFNNNSEANNTMNKLKKLGNIINLLKKRFKDPTTPSQELCIDESLTLWKGKLSFKQFIPSKRNRFEIKFFMLCECKTGYILNFIIYTGLGTEISIVPELGISGSVVQTLMKDYLKKSHILYVDNWYSSPALFDHLFKNDTGACGTVRKNKKGMPLLSEKLKRGELSYRYKNKMLALKWVDKKEVYILSTVHSPEMITLEQNNNQTNKIKSIPKCISDYNLNVGTVDKVDMQLSFFECPRKSLKWYKKIFFHLLELSLYNAYVLYKSKYNIKIQLLDFKLKIIREIFERFGSQIKNQYKYYSPNALLRLTGRHFPVKISQTKKTLNPRKNCVVCSKSKKKK